MPKLVGYRSNNDSSKYSSFCDEFSSTNDADKFTTIDLFPRMPTPVKKVDNRKNSGCCRKVLSLCCPCCCNKSSLNKSDCADAEFALVNHEQAKSMDRDEHKLSASRTSTLKMGERNAARFVSEVMSCKDTFLQKLEFANDGSMGRRRKNPPPNIKISYFSDGIRFIDLFNREGYNIILKNMVSLILL